MDAGPPPRRKMTLASRCAGWCSDHGGLCFVLLVVLTILAIGMFLFYNGYFGLGGVSGHARMAARRTRGRQKKREQQAGGEDATDDAASSGSDPETEGLINLINGEQGV